MAGWGRTARTTVRVVVVVRTRRADKLTQVRVGPSGGGPKFDHARMGVGAGTTRA